MQKGKYQSYRQKLSDKIEHLEKAEVVLITYQGN
jgi:hypothetical protein